MSAALGAESHNIFDVLNLSAALLRSPPPPKKEPFRYYRCEPQLDSSPALYKCTKASPPAATIRVDATYPAFLDRQILSFKIGAPVALVDAPMSK